VRKAWFVDVYGTKGLLKVNIKDQTLIRLGQIPGNIVSTGVDILNRALQLIRCTAQNGLLKLSGRWVNGHQAIMRQYVDSVLNRTVPPVTLEEAYSNVAILEQICSRMDLGGAEPTR